VKLVAPSEALQLLCVQGIPGLHPIPPPMKESLVLVVDLAAWKIQDALQLGALSS
jgi:hypothetical protein